MCRLCGRVVKCIFDSMPSRVKLHHVPSRRAFTTVRRIVWPQSIASRATPGAPIPSPVSLSRAFSNLTLRSPVIQSTFSTSTLIRPTILSSIQSSRLGSLSLLATRSFSTTVALQGYRRRMDTYNPSRRIQKRRHGYLARLRSKGGREILKRRRLKGRTEMSW